MMKRFLPTIFPFPLLFYHVVGRVHKLQSAPGNLLFRWKAPQPSSMPANKEKASLNLIHCSSERRRVTRSQHDMHARSCRALLSHLNTAPILQLYAAYNGAGKHMHAKEVSPI